MKLNNQRGFTLIELAVVAAILVILAVVAMSSFSSTNQLNMSRIGVLQQVAGSISAAALAKRSDQIALGNTQWNEYGTLDNRSSSSSASTTNTLFFSYINPPIVEKWEKLNAYCYRYDSNGDSAFTSSDACLYWDNSTGIAGLANTNTSAKCALASCQESLQ